MALLSNIITPSNVLKDSDIGTSVQAYDADTTKNDVANTFTANQTINGDLTVDSNTLYVDSTNNRVCVGTNSPTFAGNFVIQENATSGTGHFMQRWNTASGGVMSITVDDLSLSNPAYAIRTGTSEDLKFEMGAGEKMRITSTGSVGIGTSSPSFKLDVSGIARATSFLETVVAVTGTTPAISANSGNIQTWTLSGNSTPTDSLAAGQSVTLMIEDGAGYTITWTSLVDQWIGGSAPTLATTGYSVVELWKVSTTVYGAYVGDAS